MNTLNRKNKKLIIAKKQHVAKNIAEKIPGKKTECPGYIYIAEKEFAVSWWTRYDELPVIGNSTHQDRAKQEEQELTLSEEDKQQFEIITDLMKNSDEVIYVGNSDKEGQNLFDQVLESSNKNPAKPYISVVSGEECREQILINLRDNVDQ